MITGSCLCGTVRWEMDPPFERMRHCHCRICRKSHGAPFATYLTVDRDRFRLTSGADNVTAYQSSEAYRRALCTTCGSVVPSTENGDRVDVSAGCLDDDPGVRPAMHNFTASKAPWTDLTDSLPRNEAFEPGNASVAREGPAAAEPGTLQGSCLCGGVAYEVTAPFRVAYNCHCRRCQKARSAAHTTNGSVAADGLRYLRGEDMLVHYKVPDAQFFTHTFCRVCGSGMVPTGGSRPFVTAPMASLDGDPGIRPFHHIYANYRASWFQIADTLPRFGEGPEKRPIDYFQD